MIIVPDRDQLTLHIDDIEPTCDHPPHTGKAATWECVRRRECDHNGRINHFCQYCHLWLITQPYLRCAVHKVPIELTWRKL